MKLLILGASGRCGRWLVRLALERGHEVTAVVRDGSQAAVPGGASTVVGDVLDPAFVSEAIAGHTTVLSALGLRRRSVVPWSTLLSPPDLVQRVMANIAGAERPPERIIWVSAGGVGESRARCTPLIRAMIGAGNVGVAYRDLDAAEAVMRGAPEVSSLAVRPVTLLNGAPRGSAGEVNRYGLFSTVRRGDVARWMVDAAEREGAPGTSAVLLGRARR